MTGAVAARAFCADLVDGGARAVGSDKVRAGRIHQMEDDASAKPGKERLRRPIVIRK